MQYAKSTNPSVQHTCTASFFWFNYLFVLTVSVILVDFLVWVDLDGGSQRDGRQTSLQLGADHQVVVFIDSFKLLFDAQTLVTGLEDHLGLPGKHAACMDV